MHGVHVCGVGYVVFFCVQGVRKSDVYYTYRMYVLTPYT